MNEVIKIEKLIKSYEERMIINSIDLTINKGEFICILGTSGCGKTTLLNIIGGFLQKDHGKITLKGTQITKPVTECVMVFQELDQLFPWMTLQQNIEFALKNSKQKYSKVEINELSSKYIQMVKLQGFEKYYPNQLSGGMKQRTAIARALVTTPEVLLMDEPFGSLDVQTKKELQEILLSIWKQTKTTIVFVTHDVRESLKLADRIVIMKDTMINQIINNNDKCITEKKVEQITQLL
ncbi:MAG: ABC transporter ATP-binding protein [Eubacteriaceae bacterium]